MIDYNYQLETTLSLCYRNHRLLQNRNNDIEELPTTRSFITTSLGPWLKFKLWHCGRGAELGSWCDRNGLGKASSEQPTSMALRGGWRRISGLSGRFDVFDFRMLCTRMWPVRELVVDHAFNDGARSEEICVRNHQSTDGLPRYQASVRNC